MSGGDRSRAPSRWTRPEHLLVGALLLVALVAIPAVADVYLVQSLVLSFCAGLGIQ